VFIKDESKNPFGTAKDRRNLNIINEADRLKVDKLAMITSGSNGYSLAKFAKGRPIKIVCIISKDLNNDTKLLLKENCYQLIELNLNQKILRPEEIIAFAREAEDEVIWEVTNGYEEYYTPIVNEILKETNPNYIVVPIGSGALFVSMAEAAEKLNRDIKVIGIGVQNTIHSYADKLFTPWSPYTNAMEAYVKKGHIIYRLTEQEIKKLYNEYKNTINCEPSSSVVFAALTKHKFKDHDTVVLINSGKTL
jgi:cysteine synthase